MDDAVESRDDRCAKNDPIHPLNRPDSGVGAGAGTGWVTAILSVFNPFIGGRPKSEESWRMLTEPGRERSPSLKLASALLTSEPLLVDVLNEPLELSPDVVLEAAGGPLSLDEFELRCIHLPRTPSIAFRKLVEPALNVREIASRVGASC